MKVHRMNRKSPNKEFASTKLFLILNSLLKIRKKYECKYVCRCTIQLLLFQGRFGEHAKKNYEEFSALPAPNNMHQV